MASTTPSSNAVTGTPQRPLRRVSDANADLSVDDILG
jgi:hypothetical protein